VEGAKRGTAMKPTLLTLVLLLVATAVVAQSSRTEPVLGGPCEGCEAVFEAMPTELSWAARIAPADEPGEPLRIEGVVRQPDGAPAAGIVV
jgi:protocatechuate 3,4-dioxygenase beta subunit